MFAGFFCQTPEAGPREIIDFTYEVVREGLIPAGEETCFVPASSRFFPLWQSLNDLTGVTPPPRITRRLETDEERKSCSLVPIFRDLFPSSNSSTRFEGVYFQIPRFGPESNSLAFLQPGPLEVLMGFIQNDPSLISLMGTCRQAFARIHDQILY